jgi:ariadne-1
LSSHYEPHNCYEYAKNKAGTGNAEKESKYVLERKLFYCNRYKNHYQSLKFEKELHVCVEEKIKRIQRHYTPWCDVRNLKETVDILLQCRQTLMYTYVFAYYARKNNQFLIFEENQKDLEIATENLSGFLERDITTRNIADIGTKLPDKYRYCEKRRKILVEHVHEGYDKNWWEFTE